MSDAKEKQKENKEKSTKVSFSNEQLNKALARTHDLMERLTCPFLPLGDLARRIKQEDPLEGLEEIYIGVKHNEWTESRESMFFTLMDKDRINVEEGLNEFKFEHEGVPVRLQIIQRNYEFFKRPEIRFYGVVEYTLPNPLDKYYKVRNLIK